MAADNTVVRLGGPKQRALLALLALHADEFVRRDRVIDALWGERPPESAVNAVQVHVHGLRRLLGADRIETRGAAYVFHADHDEIDVRRFDRLVGEAKAAISQADFESALDRVESALSLVRGEPLADLQHDLLNAERRQLSDATLAAFELGVEAKLALARHEEAIPELEDMIAREPFRETLHAQLMLALYRSDRQLDALARYRSVRRLLNRELGIQPGIALRELERAILRQDASLAIAPARRALNLPRPATSLVGRGRDVEQLLALLRSQKGGRVVTLTGPGGVGKTRLAVAVAEELLAEFEHGTYFVDLSSVREEALVGPAILAALGIAAHPGRTSVETLSAELAGRRALIVLDNFEQVVAAAGDISSIAAAAPHVRLLVTSRRPLRLAGEREIRVSPLAVPTTTDGLETVAGNDSVRVFVAAASAVDDGFSLDAQNTAAVAALCQRVAGLPLALELAGARVKVVAPEEMLPGRAASLELLAGGNRDAPSRHQTLRATIDWSHALLDGRQQRLFARLSVFAGGCTFEAAEAVCESDLETLADLLDHSLVQRRRHMAGETRFSMLEPVREYAAECLAADDEELSRMRGRHAVYFTELAKRVGPTLIGPGAPAAVQRVGNEHDNLRAALAYALETDVELGFELVGALMRYWETAGRGPEILAWLDRALPQASGPVTGARTRSLLVLGRQLIDQGDHARAADVFSSALVAARRNHLTRDVAFALTQLSWLRAAEGDQEKSRQLGLEAIRDAQEAGDIWGERLALSMVAGTLVETGELTEARRLFDRSLGLARRIGDRRTLVTALNNAGWAALRDGDLAYARTTLEESLELAHELGHQSSELSALSLLGAEANLAKDPQRALRYLRHALDLGKDSGRPIYLLEAVTEVAIALSATETERAAQLLAAADEGYRARRIVRPPAEEERAEDLRGGLRQQLGATRYEGAVAYGTGISLSAAVEEALVGDALQRDAPVVQVGPEVVA